MEFKPKCDSSRKQVLLGFWRMNAFIDIICYAVGWLWKSFYDLRPHLKRAHRGLVPVGV